MKVVCGFFHLALGDRITIGKQFVGRSNHWLFSTHWGNSITKENCHVHKANMSGKEHWEGLIEEIESCQETFKIGPKSISTDVTVYAKKSSVCNLSSKDTKRGPQETGPLFYISLIRTLSPERDKRLGPTELFSLPFWLPKQEDCKTSNARKKVKLLLQPPLRARLRMEKIQLIFIMLFAHVSICCCTSHWRSLSSIDSVKLFRMHWKLARVFGWTKWSICTGENFFSIGPLLLLGVINNAGFDGGYCTGRGIMKQGTKIFLQEGRKKISWKNVQNMGKILLTVDCICWPPFRILQDAIYRQFWYISCHLIGVSKRL